MKRAKYLVVSFIMLISSAISTSFLNDTNIFAAATEDITVNIDTMEERASISPYIYGTNIQILQRRLRQLIPALKYSAAFCTDLTRIGVFSWHLIGKILKKIIHGSWITISIA